MAASPAPAGPPVWAPLPLPPPPTFSTVANEYRVCKATQWDNVTADGVDAQDKLVSTVHVVCSMLSAICCLCVLVVSMRYPALRKFPANMLLWKTACDLLTSGIIVGLNIALLSMGEDYDYTHGSALCANGVLAGLVRRPASQSSRRVARYVVRTPCAPHPRPAHPHPARLAFSLCPRPAS